MFGLDHECHVTGTLNPDAVDDYYIAGWYNGKEYAVSDSGSYYIWWDGTDTWTLSALLGTPGAAYWDRTNPSFYGVYDFKGTATGDATVVVGLTP